MSLRTLRLENLDGGNSAEVGFGGEDELVIACVKRYFSQIGNGISVGAADDKAARVLCRNAHSDVGLGKRGGVRNEGNAKDRPCCVLRSDNDAVIRNGV